MHLNPRIAALLEALNNPSLPGVDLSLERVHVLLKALGHPEAQMPPTIHLAGTNGKGSTLAYLRAIYEAEGYRVHAYSSPHLVRFNERIVIAGAEISDEYLLQLLERVSEAAKDIPVTFFEATTALAFMAFADHSADVLLLETGMGGRLDATNVIAKPVATVLTPIDYDHMEFLGKTLSDIATEKAGIMKPGAPCFVGEQPAEAREVIKRAARRVNAPLHMYGRNWSVEPTPDGLTVHVGEQKFNVPKPALGGAHQYHNAGLAVAVASSLSTLPVSEASLAKGIANATWPARLQKLTRGPIVEAWGARGEVYLDGGHNPQAARMLREWASAHPAQITLLVGMMRRKDAGGFLRPLAQCIRQCLTVSIPGNESYSADELAADASKAGFIGARALNWDALTLEGEGDLLIAGSLFLAGEVLKNHG